MTKADWHREQAQLCLQLSWLTSLRAEADRLREMAEEHRRRADLLASEGPLVQMPDYVDSAHLVGVACHDGAVRREESQHRR